MVNQTPWIERSFHFDFPVGHFPVIFSRLEGSIFRLGSMLMNADDDWCNQQRGGWSVKEHIGHLYDLESLWWQRLQDFRSGQEQLTAADIKNEKTTRAGHNKKSIEQLLLQFVQERQKLLETVFDFDEQMLSVSALHPRLQQPMRLIDSLYFVAEHDDHHLAKIAELLRKT